MKRVCAAMILFLFAVCAVWAEAPKPSTKPATTKKPETAAKDDAAALRKEFYKQRQLTIVDLKKKNDEKFLNLFRQDNLKKKGIKDKIVAKHPEVAKIKDPKERSKTVQQYFQELKKSGDKDYQEFMTIRMELDKYLLSKNPKLQAAFDKMDPSFRDKYELGKE